MTDMLATTINALNIPPLRYFVVQPIQTTAEPPTSFYLDGYVEGFNYIPGASSTVCINPAQSPSVEDLGWSEVEALETYLRLRNFADDWDAPGMEAYDDM